MKITYDPETDIAYLRFLEGDYECRVVLLTDTVAVDLGPGDRVVGIEVLHASANLNIDRGTPSVTLENLKGVLSAREPL